MFVGHCTSWIGLSSRLMAVAWALAVTLAGTSLRSELPDRSYQVDPDQSRALIAVGKAGVFSFAGHTHEVVAPVARGLVTVDAADLAHSTLHLEIDASMLRVTGKGEPAADVPAVQRTMLSDKVLDVGRYPTIVFSGTAASVEKRSGSAADLLIAGRLTLHGVTGSLKVHVHVELVAETLTARGRFHVKQTDYGITPVSVGGVVKVKDALDIEFTIVAVAHDR
jgi:polyisoprenoid-binding protein YceI